MHTWCLAALLFNKLWPAAHSIPTPNGGRRGEGLSTPGTIPVRAAVKRGSVSEMAAELCLHQTLSSSSSSRVIMFPRSSASQDPGDVCLACRIKVKNLLDRCTQPMRRSGIGQSWQRCLFLFLWGWMGFEGERGTTLEGFSFFRVSRTILYFKLRWNYV